MWIQVLDHVCQETSYYRVFCDSHPGGLGSVTCPQAGGSKLPQPNGGLEKSGRAHAVPQPCYVSRNLVSKSSKKPFLSAFQTMPVSMRWGKRSLGCSALNIDAVFQHMGNQYAVTKLNWHQKRVSQSESRHQCWACWDPIDLGSSWVSGTISLPFPLDNGWKPNGATASLGGWHSDHDGCLACGNVTTQDLTMRRQMTY